MVSPRLFFLCALGLIITVTKNVNGFLSTAPPRRQVWKSPVTGPEFRRLYQISLTKPNARVVGKSVMQMSDKNNNSNDDDRLRALGYTEEEIRRSKKQSEPEEIKVRVDLVEDVDPFTLTAIGFALIAFNFLVFANMGDGGIAGLVATIINTVNQ